MAGGTLVIDGATGEGGGQIVRSALSLASLQGRPIRIDKLRAGRPKPGLAAQHLTAARAVAELCGGTLRGDRLGSQTLSFHPAGPPRAGTYTFDVGAARKGGSAGAVSLVLQAVLPPLALAEGASALTLRGGTHMAWSPSVDYCREVWLPALTASGVRASVDLAAWGWFPVGRGEVRARIDGVRALAPLRLLERGALRRVTGRAVAANLPAHIPQRMADRARTLLAAAGIATEIAPHRVAAACPGAGLFLVAEYERARAGFTALGAPGKPSEAVAEEAVAAVLTHHRSGAAVDVHLADQLVVPAALAAGESRYTAVAASGHLRTVAWLVELFGIARVTLAGASGAVTVTVTPAARAQSPQE